MGSSHGFFATEAALKLVAALARGMLYDPRWGWHAAATLGAEVEAPPQYWRAPPHEHKALFGQTVFGSR